VWRRPPPRGALLAPYPREGERLFWDARIHNFGSRCAENFSARPTTNLRTARISRDKSEEIPSFSRFILKVE
jgi:hypothetical protein